MFDFLSSIHIADILKYSVELIMFLIILFEIRELKKHSRALHKHEIKLESVRPLITTLYTDTNDILSLAVQFTNDANILKAVGTIGILAFTEVKPGISNSEYKDTLEKILPIKLEYIRKTVDFIQSGKHYYRVMNLLPISKNEEEVWELWANIRFFLKIMESAVFRTIDLHLYHHPGLLTGQEDFHYRCSDKSVIIRAGGNLHTSANSAISITDSKVVERYTYAYDKLLETKYCKELNLDTMQRLDKLYATKDFQKIKILLSKEDAQ